MESILMGRLPGQPDTADRPERAEPDAGAFLLWVKQTRKWSLAELKNTYQISTKS